MTMSLTTQYTEPGIYIKVTNVPVPNVIGGQFIPIFVGCGRKEYDITANLTRAAGNVVDLITDQYTAILISSITDSFGNVYKNGTDYTLVQNPVVTPPVPNGYYVNWSNPVSITGTNASPFTINGQTLQINIDGNTKNVTFSVSDPEAITDIVTAINTAYSPSTPAANDGSGHLKLTGNTLAMVVGGNAMDTLGFVKGQNDKAQCNRPADGVGYVVVYKRLKLTSEYVPHLFSRLNDVYAEHGPYAIPNAVDIGDGGTVTTPQAVGTNVLVDTSADFSNVSVADYVKIVGGSGTGQIRVITAVNPATFTLTIGDTWADVLDGSSQYVIYDGPISEISIAATIAQEHGAVNFMTSQSYDDIVDDNNMRKAITATENLVDGQQGWCLIYLKGVDASDSIVSFIKQYLSNMNNPLAKQERMALLGVKASTINYQDVISLASGINDPRIGVVANPYATITGIGQLDASYIAAAISGIICNPAFDPGEPISGKALLFDGVDDPYLRSEKRQMGAAGAIIIEKQGVDYNILHYLSTSPSDIINSELKVIKQIDDLKKTLRGTLQSALVNVRIVNKGKNIISIADSLMNLILSQKVEVGSISAYSNLKEAFNTLEPRELDISFLFQPTFDLNYVVVNFGATVSQ